MLTSNTKQRLFDTFLKGQCEADHRDEESIPKRNPSSSVPLSLAQEQLWLRSLPGDKNQSLCNETITIHGDGPLDVRILEQSFAEIVRRHEVWRTSIDVKDGQAVQIVNPARDAMDIPKLDLRYIPVAQREEHAKRVISEKAEEVFDLRSGPLVKALLVMLDDMRYRFVVIAHRSVVDGVSAYQIFPSELADLYSALSAGQPSPLSELPIQFGDFSIWQRKWLCGDTRAEQYDYWKKRLAPPLTESLWPKQSPRRNPRTSASAILPFAVPLTISEAAEQTARREGATVFAVLLASFAALLHRRTQQEDITVGTLSPAGRKRAECQKLLGYFLNPVALRFDFSAKPTFRELLSQTRGILGDAISHDDIPFETLERELNLGRNGGSFLRLAISLQPTSPVLTNGWQVTTMDTRQSESRWDFYLAFIQRDFGLEGRAQYNPELLDEREISATVEEFFHVLSAATAESAVTSRQRDGLNEHRALALGASTLPEL